MSKMDTSTTPTTAPEERVLEDDEFEEFPKEGRCHILATPKFITSRLAAAFQCNA
jgi:hypothetical protein